MKSVEAMREEGEKLAAGYGRPASELRGYAGVMAAYVALVSGIAWGLDRKGRLPARLGVGDLTLVALATHKLSRTISKDAVASPLRAPFTRFEGRAAPGEVQEEVAASGAGKAVGELLSCPFCLDQWVASAFVTGLVVAPRVTRYVAGIFAVRAGADLLQFGYAAADQAV
jgi:hypothetical protein